MKVKIIAILTAITISLLAGCSENVGSTNKGNSPSALTANSSPTTSFSPSNNTTTANTSIHLISPSPSVSQNTNIEDTTQSIYEKYKGDKTNKEDIKSMMAALPGLHWKKFDKLTGGNAIEFINWLREQDYSDKNNLVSLLNSTDELDGALTDGYAGLITNLFLSDTKIFIESLAQLDDNKAAAIYPLIAYGTGNGTHAGNSIFDVNNLVAGNELSTKEKTVADSLLKAMTIK